MITGPELRKMARERNLRLDIIEKDYALGWIMMGIYNSSLKRSLIFKGGTALSKIYFPLNWRISEDLISRYQKTRQWRTCLTSY